MRVRGMVTHKPTHPMQHRAVWPGCTLCSQDARTAASAGAGRCCQRTSDAGGGAWVESDEGLAVLHSDHLQGMSSRKAG